MTRGDGVIVQAALREGIWSGRADVLRRVETPSALGAWSYEVTDTKLARETKGNTVLQLSLYSDLLASVQQQVPESAYVVTPGTAYLPEAYRVADFAAFYRRIRQKLEAFAAAPPQAGLYPDTTAHCEVCRWREPCAARRRADDHLSLVAGIAKTQIEELARRGVDTMAALAALPLPLPWRPERGTAPSYEKVREQARLQVAGRAQGQLLYETLPLVADFGLYRLPEPSAGDIFFDFEGDSFVDSSGLEFLFGYLFLDDDGTDAYVGDWVTTRQQERKAFEPFIDFVTARLTKYPSLHIYHFAPYEPAALKRLMGRYATREDEVDNLLRAGLFVDPYAVVRQGIRAGVESYSIKKLEPLYAFDRVVPLIDVGCAMARVQACLELADARLVDEILASKATWIGGDGKESLIRLEDILIIAPYNAQVFELQERLPGARIGTVDKFQGQEAPIAIYSMTTSSHADAPRGMEFLYSLNRLNVATSRAKCLCILVASPRLFEAECRTPRQMQLLNAFCRYLELAKSL
jgi:uncharacterized protein